MTRTLLQYKVMVACLARQNLSGVFPTGYSLSETLSRLSWSCYTEIRGSSFDYLI
jgi:hypothetical protein